MSKNEAVLEQAMAELPPPAMLEFPVMRAAPPKPWTDAMSEAKRARELAGRGRWKEAAERYLWIARSLENVDPHRDEIARATEVAYENAALCSRAAWRSQNATPRATSKP